MTDTDLTLFILDKAISSAHRERKLTDCFLLLRRAYFEEYEDATEMDWDAENALRHWWDIAFPCGDDADGNEFEDIIKRPRGKR